MCPMTKAKHQRDYWQRYLCMNQNRKLFFMLAIDKLIYMYTNIKILAAISILHRKCSIVEQDLKTMFFTNNKSLEKFIHE